MAHSSENAKDALYNQWRNFSSSGQWDRARDVLGELLTLDPDEAWLHDQMGNALYQLDEYPASEIHFKKSIKLAPIMPMPFKGSHISI